MKVKDRQGKIIPTAILQSGEKKFSWLRDLKTLSIADLIEIYAYAEAIVETVRQPLIVLDKNLKVRSTNQAFFDTFKMTEKETLGKYVYDLNGGEWNIPALKKLLETILPQNSHFNDFEVRHNFDRLGPKIMLLNARRIILKENKTQLILLAIEDITKLKEDQHLREEFMNILAHELKTPITAIRFFAEILHKQLHKKGDKDNKYLTDKITRQTKKLTSLINEILTAGKIEAGQLSLSKKNINLDALLEQIVKDYQYTTKEHVLVLKGKIGKKVLCDEHRIEQVLTNLLTNAIKYSPKRGKIIIKAHRKNQEVVISVQDFGLGMNKKDLPKLFQRFYRTEEKGSITGFGLGLYISSEIVKRHNGRIWVDSKKGQGSTFSFALPIT